MIVSSVYVLLAQHKNLDKTYIQLEVVAQNKAWLMNVTVTGAVQSDINLHLPRNGLDAHFRTKPFEKHSCELYPQ
jgi:hypothetical protein